MAAAEPDIEAIAASDGIKVFTYSDAVVEKREVLVRDIHDEFEPFERQSITFIVLQPGSKVIVPPNPNNKDPAHSEAICDGGAVCLENGVYELEWSGGIVGFSSQTAEEFTDSGASITFFETDQFDTELCFVVLESQTAVPSSTGFTDVKATDFFAKPVKWALEHQITGGTSKTQFSPQQPCSISQILTFLYRANGSPETKINNPFSDVSSSNYYYLAALWAYENGLVSRNKLNGETPCTRAMATGYLWKLAGSPTQLTSKYHFSDVPASASYAKAIAWAVDGGITSGTAKTTFSPDTVCNRGQIITFLYRAMA